MIWAFHRLQYSATEKQLRYTNSRLYEAARKKFIKVQFDEEFKNKVSSRVKGTFWINNGQKNKMIKNSELQKYIELGWVQGRLPLKMKGKPRKKFSKPRKYVEPHYWVYNQNFSTDKMVTAEELNRYLEDGWKRGRLQYKKSNFGKNCVGRIRVYNPELNIEKSILPEELLNYQNLGYKKGRKPVSDETREKMSKAHKCSQRRMSDAEKN